MTGTKTRTRAEFKRRAEVGKGHDVIKDVRAEVKELRADVQRLKEKLALSPAEMDFALRQLAKGPEMKA